MTLKGLAATLPPAKTDGFGYIYVILFDTGAIKLGRTCNPRARVNQHSASVARYGVTISDVWFSVAHHGEEESERMLLARTAEMDGVRQYGSEYFVGLTFDVAVQIAAEVSAAQACRIWREPVSPLELVTRERPLEGLEEYDRGYERCSDIPGMMYLVYRWRGEPITCGRPEPVRSGIIFGKYQPIARVSGRS